MPGYDGRGPRGMGSMTGGGRGYCNPATRPIYGGGYGVGRGWGRGRGRAFRNRFWAAEFPGPMRVGGVQPWNTPYGGAPGRQQEVDFLRDQAASLKEELEAIDRRLRELETEPETPE